MDRQIEKRYLKGYIWIQIQIWMQKRWCNRQIDKKVKQTDGWIIRQIDSQVDRYMNTYLYIQIERQIDRQIRAREFSVYHLEKQRRAEQQVF